MVLVHHVNYKFQIDSKAMLKFTPYFYKLKSMLLDKNIPVEFRAKFITEKGLSLCWRKIYNYNMYTDDRIEKNFSDGYWEHSLAWKLHKVTLRDVSSIMDIDLKHPEISQSDLVTALILWGRGPAIVKKVLEMTDVPEKDEFMNLLNEAKKWKKEKKSLPKDHGWWYR